MKKLIPNCGARLDRLPDCRWHLSIFMMVSFSLLVCWSNAIGGLVLAQLKEIGWTDNATSAVFTSLTTAGMFVGALAGGVIGDRIGRRRALLVCQAVHIASMLAAVIAPNMGLLIFCRLIQGIGLGALLVTLFAGFTEYMPGRNRGTWSSRASFIGNWSYPLCSSIAVLISPILSADMNWRVQFLIPSALSLVAAILAWARFPESPRWLESQGRFDEADAIMSEIESRVEAATGSKLPEPELRSSETAAVKSLPFSALLEGNLLRRVILGSFVLIAMNVVQYTLINWLPTIFLTQGINLSDSIVLNTMSMFGAPFGIFIAMLVMDRVPRKAMGIGLLMLIAVLGIIYAMQRDMTTITVVGFFLITFVYMYVCYASAVYVPEIWPTAAKLRGNGLANAVGRMSGILAPYAVAALLDSTGVMGVFALLGGVSVIVAIAIATIGIETRGVSVETIGSVEGKGRGAIRTEEV
ncbi:major facilitator superfamily MFS_1 [Coriobacterium glomerans PW2]|uniref:Major facilitator superfamily MFS_1 n=1 Tax=Coriobacterium glomerans (strain ATCC 49209 / DSM 20642 / JCM 10262 / PW2) TaxID=700015 RepID=F2N8Z4_CORGP|nr:MFS transporter [Coriobacterium glomerans]AEB07594.1 major facilitator superfamily MFS_1 [Coriobacterium glomerans PW2]